MRKLFSLIIAVLLTATLWAQSPEKMSYQAVIRNSSNQLITNQAVGMQISVLQSSASGTVVYVETQTPTTNVNGLVSIEIGNGTLISGDFATINWANGPYFIKTETDPAGGTNYTITGTNQLLSVPYALHAKIAESVIDSIKEMDPVFVTSVAAGITGTDTAIWNHKQDQLTGTAIGQMLYWNDTAWVRVASGLNGQILKYQNGVPTWADGNINDLSIGDGYQGGIIAYILQPGDPGYDSNVRHGIIAAPSDQSTNAMWGCYGTTISGADGSEIGTGAQNTVDIENGCPTPGTAADICANLVLGGYNDWYLPSKDELYKLYLNQVEIGGFSSGLYWSSSEYGDDTARAFNFYDGSLNNGYYKYNATYVRAVRAF